MKKRMLRAMSCFLLAFATHANVLADTTTYYSKVTASAAPTGCGKVYVTTETTANPTYRETSEKTQSGTTQQQTYYLYAQASEDYVFSRWTKDGATVSADNPYEVTVNGDSGDSNYSKSSDYVANFVEAGLVRVASDAAGSATIDNPSNRQGETVVLTAKVANIFKARFLGWSKDGSDELIKDNPLTLTAAEKATYTAKFEEVDGVYCRVYTHFNRYMWVLGDSYLSTTSSDGFTGAIFRNSLTAGNSINGQSYESSPATVIYVTGTKDGKGLSRSSMSAQGVNTQEVMAKRFLGSLTTSYNGNKDAYQCYIDVSGNRYLKDGGSYGGRCKDEGNGMPMIICGGNDDATNYKLQILSEETIDDAYFGVVPSVGAEKDGRYYTTMYTAFPYKCHDDVKAYTVDQVTDDGVAHLAEIESGEVPSYTPVVLACTGTTAKQNRLVPLLKEPAAPEGENLLKGVLDIYHGNDDASTWRTSFDASSMRVLSNSEAAFVNQNNNATDYLTNNTCYIATDTPIEKLTLDARPMASPVKGYFRVKNAGANSQDKRTVYVTGESTADPTSTSASAVTQPGSVLFINATPYENDPSDLLVVNLRSQGVDALSAVYGGITSNMQDGFKSALTVFNALFSWGFSTEKLEELNAAMFEKMQMFMEPTTTSDGQPAYYLKSSTPTVQPVLNALTNEQIERLNLTGDISQAFGKLLLDKAAEEFTNRGQEQIATLFQEYANRINMGQTYYLITGRVYPNFSQETQTFSYDENAPSLGFANNNPYDWSDKLKPEIEVAGDYAKWIVTPVTETENYFAVAPSEKMQDNDGHYYTSLFLDFPFEVKGSGMRVWTIEGEPQMETFGGEELAVVTTKELTGVIPARTPVVVECVSTSAADNIIQPVDDPFGESGASFLQGTFFGGKFVQEGASYSDNDEFTYRIYWERDGETVAIARKQFRVFSKNSDERNPIGFFRYKGSAVAGNRAFMVLDGALAGAKVVIGSADGATDGIADHEAASLSGTDASEVFDLQGRRVSNLQKGIYIVNGKKIIIR
ncbi:MAG: hypothetical protein IJ196_08830 [Prevotella sp.]|nr:hypothetical protein [Prevotella sp.]